VVTKTNGEDNRQKERTAHVSCVVFNPSAELEQRLTSSGKGTPVELEGRISTSSFESNGERRYVTEVVAFNRSLVVAKN
jgi:single-stranded DNA-binding protein